MIDRAPFATSQGPWDSALASGAALPSEGQGTFLASAFGVLAAQMPAPAQGGSGGSRGGGGVDVGFEEQLFESYDRMDEKQPNENRTSAIEKVVSHE